jgi:TPR repeat protein
MATDFAGIGLSADEALKTDGTEIRSRLAKYSSIEALEQATSDEAATLRLIAANGRLWGELDQTNLKALESKVAEGNDPRGWVQLAMSRLASKPANAEVLMTRAAERGWEAHDDYKRRLVLLDNTATDTEKENARSALRASWAEGSDDAGLALYVALDAQRDSQERQQILETLAAQDRLLAIYQLALVRLADSEQETEGHTLLLQAAERDHPDARLKIAERLLKSKATQEEGIKHAVRAGELGRTRGYILAANRLGDPNFEAHDKVEAKTLLEKAWNRGEAFAATRLSALYGDAAVFNDPENARVWAERGAEAGSASSAARLARYRFEDGDKTGSIEAAKLSASGGNGEGSLLLAKLLLRGEGADSDASARAFIEAAERGQTEAYEYAASLLFDGSDGIDQDEVRGIDFAKKSEQAGGSLRSAIVLALAYDQGRGVERDRKIALSYWQRAAELNSSLARRKLSNYYLSGDIGVKDVSKAVEWSAPLAESTNSLDRAAYASALDARANETNSIADQRLAALSWLSAAELAEPDWQVRYARYASTRYLKAKDYAEAIDAAQQGMNVNKASLDSRIQATCNLPYILRRSMPSLHSAIEQGPVDRMTEGNYYQAWPDARKKRHNSVNKALENAFDLAMKSRSKASLECLDKIGAEAYGSPKAHSVANRAYLEAARRNFAQGNRSEASRQYQNAAYASLEDPLGVTFGSLSAKNRSKYQEIYKDIKLYCDTLKEGQNKGLYSVAKLQKEKDSSARSICLREWRRSKLWE